MTAKGFFFSANDKDRRADHINLAFKIKVNLICSHLTDTGSPCAPPGGAQRRLVVHDVVLYPRGGAQHSSHKPLPSRK